MTKKSLIYVSLMYSFNITKHCMRLENPSVFENMYKEVHIRNKERDIHGDPFH